MTKILIVDDDPNLVDFLKLLLDSEGYETSEAYDGKSALEKIASYSPEVVLLDYMMPNMHGLEVLRNVARDYSSSLVIMLTGKGSEEVAVECMKAGAADYVVKPFDNDHLIAVIRNVLRVREARSQKQMLDAVMERKRAEITHLLDSAFAVLNSIPAATPGAAELTSLLQQLRGILR
jgi:DNA-binding response OmpR family regulator